MMTAALLSLTACQGVLYDGPSGGGLEGTPPRQGQDGGLPEGDADHPETEGRPPSGPVNDWSILIDTSATDPYADLTATTHTVEGWVVAPSKLSTFTVGGQNVIPDAEGHFSAQVSIEPGLNVVDIEAEDLSDPINARLSSAAVLASDYLPEGEMNPEAALLVLTDAIVGPMAAPMQELVSDIDVVGEILSRPVLSQDSTCTTYPSGASQGTPSLNLRVSGAGQLVLEVIIPNVRIDFYGQCSAPLLGTMNITGDMTTDLAIVTTLSAPPQEGCLRGLDHSPPVVETRGFDVDVSGGSGLFDSLIVMLMGEITEGDQADTLASEVGREAQGMIGPELEDVVIFESSEVMELLGASMNLDLCVTGLTSSNGLLLATVGAVVEGTGTAVNEAPGAPMTAGELPTPQADSFYLDANLVGQLVYSAWLSGGLDAEGASQIPFSLLAMIASDLDGLYPEGTMIDVSISGRLAPRASAVEEGSGDLILELGGLILDLDVAGEFLFRVGTHLTLVLDLRPEGAGLKPAVVSARPHTFLIEEPQLDIDDALLTSAVDLQMGATAGDLLGDAVIGLPEIGDGALTPVDAEPVPGGRYIRVVLQ